MKTTAVATRTADLSQIHYVTNAGQNVDVVYTEGMPSLDANTQVALNTLTIQVRQYDDSMNMLLVQTCLAVHGIREIVGRGNWMPYVRANLPLNSLRSIERKAEIGGLIKAQIGKGKFGQEQFANYSQRAMEALFEHSEAMVDKLIPALANNSNNPITTKEIDAASKDIIMGLQAELDKVTAQKKESEDLANSQRATLDSMSVKVSNLDDELDRVSAENRQLKTRREQQAAPIVEIIEAPKSQTQRIQRDIEAQENRIAELTLTETKLKKQVDEARISLNQKTAEKSRIELSLDQVAQATNDMELLTQAVGYLLASYPASKLEAMIKVAPHLARPLATVASSVELLFKAMQPTTKTSAKK